MSVLCGWRDTRRRHCCVHMMSSLAPPHPLLHIPHIALILSPDSLSSLTSPFNSSSDEVHPDFPDETRLSTPVSDSHERYMTLTQHLSKAFTLLTHTLHLPLLFLLLSSLLLWPFPFLLSSPYAFPTFSFSLTRPLVLYDSSNANGPRLERRCSTRPTRVE